MADDYKGISEIFQEEFANPSNDAGVNEGEGQDEQSNDATTPEDQSKNKSEDDFESDEEFQKSVPKEFNKHKDWRSLYKGKKDAERKMTELQEKLNQFENQSDDDDDDVNNNQKAFSDADLLEIAKQKGYTLTKQEKQDIAKLDQLISNAQSEEEKVWLKNYASTIMEDTSKQIYQKLDPLLNQVTEMIIENRLTKSHEQAKNHIDMINKKYGSNIDYDKDIDPEIVALLKTNKNLVHTDLFQLTKEVLANKGIEFGRRISQKESNELNEKKKKANMENEGNFRTHTSLDNEGKTATQIFKEELQREGIKL